MAILLRVGVRSLTFSLRRASGEPRVKCRVRNCSGGAILLDARDDLSWLPNNRAGIPLNYGGFKLRSFLLANVQMCAQAHARARAGEDVIVLFPIFLQRLASTKKLV